MRIASCRADAESKLTSDHNRRYQTYSADYGPQIIFHRYHRLFKYIGGYAPPYSMFVHARVRSPYPSLSIICDDSARISHFKSSFHSFMPCSSTLAHSQRIQRHHQTPHTTLSHVHNVQFNLIPGTFTRLGLRIIIMIKRSAQRLVRRRTDYPMALSLFPRTSFGPTNLVSSTTAMQT